MRKIRQVRIFAVISLCISFLPTLFFTSLLLAATIEMISRRSFSAEPFLSCVPILLYFVASIAILLKLKEWGRRLVFYIGWLAIWRIADLFYEFISPQFPPDYPQRYVNLSLVEKIQHLVYLRLGYDTIYQRSFGASAGYYFMYFSIVAFGIFTYIYLTRHKVKEQFK